MSKSNELKKLIIQTVREMTQPQQNPQEQMVRERLRMLMQKAAPLQGTKQIGMGQGQTK